MATSAGKRRRLTHRADIDAVFRQGRRLGDGRVTLLARSNGLEFSRVGVAVSAGHGAAVRRNRLKRLCREAMRLARPELPVGWDFMVVPRRGELPTLAALRTSLVRLAGRLTERAPAPESPP